MRQTDCTNNHKKAGSDIINILASEHMEKYTIQVLEVGRIDFASGIFYSKTLECRRLLACIATLHYLVM